MLLKRIKTALILASGFVIISTQSSVSTFSFLISGSMVFVAWEWAALAGFSRRSEKVIYVVCFISIISFLYLKLRLAAGSGQINEELSLAILLGGVGFWITTTFFLYHYPKYNHLWNGRFKLSIVGLLAVVPAWVGMILLKYFNSSGYLLLLIVILVASTDVGAYFIGRNFGRRKLAENLSPNKTWEGVWGGAVVCMLMTILLMPLTNLLITDVNGINKLSSVVVVFSVIFFSTVGDLLESMLKRNQGIKDSGDLLPGHGGILDRIDGLLAVAPCFTLILFAITR